MLNNSLRKNHYIDKELFMIVVLLTAFGTVVMYSASSIISLRKYDSDMYFLYRHMLWLITGISLAGIAYIIEINWVKKYAVRIFFLTIGIVLLGFLFNNGSGPSRWLIYLENSKKITTSDFARLAIIIFTAWHFDKYRKKLSNFDTGLKPLLIPAGIMIILIALQPDLSTALVIGSILFIMLFIAGIPGKILGVIAAVPVPLVTGYILYRPYMVDRIKGWLWWMFPEANLAELNWQVTNAISAMGSGGFFGRGLGHGLLKTGYIPQIQTDFVFSVIGEEFGLIIEIIVLAGFILLFAKGIHLAKKARDPFSMFLVIGISVNFIIYTIINVGYVTGLLPTTGLPLPFISYGGSHTWINFIMIGLLLNIAREAKLHGR